MTQAIVRPAARRPAGLHPQLLRQLEGLGDVRGDGPFWLELVGPEAEARTLLSLLGDPGATDEPDAVVWECGGERWLGWGAAAEIAVAGAGRFEDVLEAARSTPVGVLRSQGAQRHGAATPARWFGGFAFDTGGAEEGGWRPFGDARFLLPRIAVRRDRSSTSWFVTLAGGDLRRPLESETLALVSVAWASLEEGHGRTVPETSWSGAASARGLGRGPAPKVSPRFGDLIEEVVDLIRAGGAQKIVAADQRSVELAVPARLDSLLAAWSERAAESTRFLFRRGTSAFLGATPERLVRRQGLRVVSQALAGTAPKGAGGEAEELARRLVDSAKERQEHAFVVGHIVDRLRPLCAEVEVGERPRILELRDLLHLQTPVEGVLASPLHVLELVRALHPTPAVCGLPVETARRWIREHEVGPRGWYSGPVGWFDAEGDGDFHVALRSVLLGDGVDRPDYRTARLYAGVGLVAESAVADELAEVDSKLLTAGRVLDRWIAPPDGTD